MTPEIPQAVLDGHEPLRIGDADLWCGDCLTILLRLGKVDAVIVDPVWPNCPPHLLCGWEEPEHLLASALDALQIDADRLVIILRSDSDPRFLACVPAKWRFVCVQELAYAVPMYVGRVLGGTELAYCFGSPIPSVPGQRVIPMWGPKAQPSDRLANGHPCSRSAIHMEWLVYWWSNRAETVLDPFMGSGTTGVACAKLGRRFIGIEIDPGYFAIAVKRIAAAYAEPRLALDEPKAKPAQARML